MVAGFLLGAFRLAVDTPVALQLPGYEHGYTPGTFLWIVNNIYFQYFSVIVLIFSILVMIGVSYATKAPSESSLTGLTFATVTDEHRAESRSSWGRGELVGSIVVLFFILAAYLYFNG
jgi:SSS family solute:Na+ symporter